MGAKEKAEDLVDKFYQTTPNEYFVNEPIGIKGRYKSWEQAKQCAKIAVNEMIDVYASACVAMGMSKEDAEKQESKYLQEVKQEIENL
jgi:hypothetical protein